MTTQKLPESEVCTRVHIQPAPGRQVPQPERGMALLPPEGALVPNTVYWKRRIADSDVVVFKNPATKPATKGAAAK